MKILAAITPLLLVVGVRAGHPGDPTVPSYLDTCNYTEDTLGLKQMLDYFFVTSIPTMPNIPYDP